MSRAAWWAPVALALLSGCASVGIDEAVQQTNRQAQAFTGGQLALARTEADRARRQARADTLLAQPLTQADAVQLALLNSPALQALLAEQGAELAAAQQAGRLANPVFSFERIRLGTELEIGRLLSFGLLDLLLWPQRMAVADSLSVQARLQLTGTVVDQLTQVRQAWVRAVAAQQQLQYAGQVQRAAKASAELARRMQQVGNFSRLQRVRQQLFYADATAELATAQQQATAAREALVRALGLDDAQATGLRLPERLADLPGTPRAPHEVAADATAQRLDLQQARARLEAAGRAQGLNRLASFIDLEAGVRRDTVFDGDGTRGTRRGFALDIRLPLFDWGGAQREALDARTLAAAYRYDATARAATSQLREDYAAYRTAFDLARHAREELLPLHQAIADENLLRYNGMLIGVFELLAEARNQVAAVRRALAAQQQFWLADAALAASVMGRPVAGTLADAPPAAAATTAAH